MPVEVVSVTVVVVSVSVEVVVPASAVSPSVVVVVVVVEVVELLVDPVFSFSVVAVEEVASSVSSEAGAGMYFFSVTFLI